MEDFAFGTMSTENLKHTHHRAEKAGLQHLHRIDPIVPAPGEPVTLTVTVGSGLDLSKIICYYTTDGSDPKGKGPAVINGELVSFIRRRIDWDSICWDYIETWDAIIPAQADGTMVRYQICGWQGGSPEIVYADWPEVELVVEESARAFFHDDEVRPVHGASAGEPRTFIYEVQAEKGERIPNDSVIYQVFVDRFYPGDDRDWIQTEDLNTWFGGTLWGVRDKLDYIAGLGADTVWLSPTWAASTYHGYDITDYRKTADEFGGDEAMRALIEAAHARGLKVFLDFVVNHLSNEHPVFDEALNDESSPYRDWFFFDESNIGYRSFFGVRSMPQINLDHPGARAWMIENGRYWIDEFDVDGFRLDHSNGPGPDFWFDFRAAMRKSDPDFILFGEVVEPPATQRRYVGGLDGLLDFNLCDMIRRVFAYGSIMPDVFSRFLDRHASYFNLPNFQRYVFFDNHDMDRFLFIAGEDKSKLLNAFRFLAGMPNPLVVYYGTEVGLSQPASKTGGAGLEVSRLPMLWGEDGDAGLLDEFKGIIAVRKGGRAK